MTHENKSFIFFVLVRDLDESSGRREGGAAEGAEGMAASSEQTEKARGGLPFEVLPHSATRCAKEGRAGGAALCVGESGVGGHCISQ